MDDDLRMLTATLAKPDPSRDVVDQGRHQLQNAMRGPVRGRRYGWIAGGLGLTAAAATAAIVVASGSTAPTATPNSPPAAVATTPQSARQILLAAADTAMRSPQPTGVYWYVRTVYNKTAAGQPAGPGSSVETWTRRDGRSWARVGGHGRVVENGGRNGVYADGFEVGSVRLGYAQIQRLPTDPVALRAWVKKHTARDESVIGNLFGVIDKMPAPPKVRAAAFRSLAALPGARSLGRVQGGVGLLLPDQGFQEELIIDPATSQLRSSTFTGFIHGKKVGGSEIVDAAEWTNTLPG